MHKSVKVFCLQVKASFPSLFKGKEVLDCGSLDINGNNRYLFEGCSYTGIDIVEGKNVDVVTKVHEYAPGKLFDVVMSTEMLEHDEHAELSLKRMFDLLKPGGLLLLTAAGSGRPEHGTHDHHPGDSPATHHYYRNIDVRDLVLWLDRQLFDDYDISYKPGDIRFAGIKKKV